MYRKEFPDCCTKKSISKSPKLAAKAKAALHKRQFDGNTVLASFVPEDPTTGSAPPA
mgnify:CR=1 FL=1